MFWFPMYIDGVGFFVCLFSKIMGVVVCNMITYFQACYLQASYLPVSFV